MPFKAQKTHELVDGAKEWTSQKVRIVKAATKSKEAFQNAFNKERLKKSYAKMRGKRKYQHQVAKPVAKTVVADDEWFCAKHVGRALRKCCYFMRHGEMPAEKEPVYINAELQRLFEFLDIEDEMKRTTLVEQFWEMDNDSSGSVDLQEFLDYYKLERSEYAERAFALFDADGNRTLSMKEVIMGIYNFCTFHHDGLIQFSFDLYDTDSSGELDASEVEEIVKNV